MSVKMKMEMKNRSHRSDINRPTSRHGRKYSKYKKCLGIIMLILTIMLYIKQNLGNI